MSSHFHLLPQHAKELLGASKTRGGSTFIFQQEQSRVERALETALKDNNFIYHDKIPDLKALQPIGKAVVAKATPVSQPMSAKFTGSVSALPGDPITFVFFHSFAICDLLFPLVSLISSTVDNIYLLTTNIIFNSHCH